MMRIGRRTRGFLGITAILVVVRALLPLALQRYVNRTLDAIPGYSGHIGDVDLNLWRGAYEIEDVALVKTTGRVPVPLFSSPKVDLSVEWGQLWKGRLVGEIDLDEPEINFVSAPTPEGQQGLVDASWIDHVKDLFPLKLNRVRVHRGTVHYRDFHSSPKVDLELNDVEGVATNLTNRPTPDVELPAAVHVTALPPGGGSFLLDGKLAPLADDPTFSIDTTVERVALPALNDFLKAYANIDAEGGTFSAYAELAAKEGSFQGYVKPLLKDIQVAKSRKDEGLERKLWESIVQLAAKVLENPEKERVATRIPLGGRFDQPQPDLWATIGGLLRNAFIQALMPGIDGSIGAPNESGQKKKSRESSSKARGQAPP
jgi:Domain of Unknown Function (DUF748)